MKRSTIVLLVVLTALIATGCSSAARPSSNSPTGAATGVAQSAPTGKAVWDTTLSTGAYKSWPTAPGYATTKPARGPHGKFVQVFVSTTIMDTLNSGPAAAWPVGGMIAKDAYGANKKLTQIEFMQKTSSGWYFASFSTSGTVLKAGVKVQPCWGCHSKNSSDGVHSFKLPQ